MSVYDFVSKFKILNFKIKNLKLLFKDSKQFQIKDLSTTKL